MAIFFFDSNAIIKYYINEPGSGWVRHIADSPTNSIAICSIAQPEVASALAQLQRNKRFGKPFMNRTYQKFLEDMNRGFFSVHPLNRGVIDLSARLAFQYPLKAYDAVQVATAFVLQNSLGLGITFASGDRQALRAAQTEKLAIDNPFDHLEYDLQGDGKR